MWHFFAMVVTQKTGQLLVFKVLNKITSLGFNTDVVVNYQMHLKMSKD